jgi:short-subunit dehydrogenase
MEPIAGVKTLELDVRDDESVRRCIASVHEKAGRLDALVNNAGITMFGAVEELCIEEAKALFETNFFGVVRTSLAVLPIMRAQGFGRIVNVGSIAGFLPTPFETMYGASKHAIEGFSESLHYEVEPFGISVSIIQPGFVRTAMDRNYTEAATHLDAYAAIREQAMETANTATRKGADPEMVARIILRALQSKNPKLRYLAGWDAIGTRLARSVVPPGLFAIGVRAELKLRKSAEPPIKPEGSADSA